MKFSEIPQRLHALLMPPEPIIINHVIRYPSPTWCFSELLFLPHLWCKIQTSFLCLSVDPNDQKKTACYDIDVEVDDTLKTQMNSFLLSTASQQEIAGLDNKVWKFLMWLKASKVVSLFWLDKQSSKCSAHHCRGERCRCLCCISCPCLLHIKVTLGNTQAWMFSKGFFGDKSQGVVQKEKTSCFLSAMHMFNFNPLCLLRIFSSLVTTPGMATGLTVVSLLPQLLHASCNHVFQLEWLWIGWTAKINQLWGKVQFLWVHL